MSNNNNDIPPPFRGNPIPPANINHNPSQGRRGPVVHVPIPRNLDGRPDYSRAPGLDLSHIVPVGNSDIGSRLNTNPPPTEGTEGTPSFNNQETESKPSKPSSSNPNSNNNKEQEEEEDEDEEEEDGPPIMTPTSETDALTTTSLLSSKVPLELVEEILDHAEYFPHQILGSRSESVTSAKERVYLSVQIPDFPSLDSSTAGKGGAEGSGGRPHRVRKIRFWMKMHDQGWSSYPRYDGTYRSWGWTFVQIWREREGPPQEGDEDGKYKVMQSHLQTNKRAERQAMEHEIIWDWKEEELHEDDDEKWEPPMTNEEGEIENPKGWHKDGRLASNGKFVRELRGRDEIRIMMKALYPGWSCTVDAAEVEAWWAV